MFPVHIQPIYFFCSDAIHGENLNASHLQYPSYSPSFFPCGDVVYFSIHIFIVVFPKSEEGIDKFLNELVTLVFNICFYFFNYLTSKLGLVKHGSRPCCISYGPLIFSENIIWCQIPEAQFFHFLLHCQWHMMQRGSSTSWFCNPSGRGPHIYIIYALRIIQTRICARNSTTDAMMWHFTRVCTVR